MSGAPPAVPPPKAGGGRITLVLTLLVPAIAAGAASFGGAKMAAKQPPPVTTHVVVPVKPPGTTVALDPFLVAIVDANKKPHAMKISLAVEFDPTAKEDPKAFIPRIRDTTLVYFRAFSFEDTGDVGRMDRARTDLLERYRAVGALAVERVLVTDLVVQ